MTMRDELCTALGLHATARAAPGRTPSASTGSGGGISRHELGRKWRAVPWRAVLDGEGEAPYYFMRSGLIRKDLLPQYAGDRLPLTIVVRSHAELVRAVRDPPADAAASVLPVAGAASFAGAADAAAARAREWCMTKWVLKYTDSSNAWGMHFFDARAAWS